MNIGGFNPKIIIVKNAYLRLILDFLQQAWSLQLVEWEQIHLHHKIILNINVKSRCENYLTLIYIPRLLGNGIIIIIVISLSRVHLFAIPWTAACQTPLSMELSRQKSWRAEPVPSGDLPNPVIQSGTPALQADSLSSESPGDPLVLEVQFELTRI